MRDVTPWAQLLADIIMMLARQGDGEATEPILPLGSRQDKPEVRGGRRDEALCYPRCTTVSPTVAVPWSHSESLVPRLCPPNKSSEAEGGHPYFPEGRACVGILSQNLRNEKI